MTGKGETDQNYIFKNAAMESILNEAQLRQLASKMGKEWKAVASYLGVTDVEVYQLQVDNPAVEDQIFRMLIIWWQKWDRSNSNGNGSPLEDLCNALVKARRVDLAELLQGLTHGAYFSIDACRSEFIRYYNDFMGVVPMLPWHPSEVKRIKDIFVKLKLIERENKGGRIVQRDLNSYEEMLSLEYQDGQPVRYILLSGIAGSGKTTIASKIAYDWAQEMPESPLSKFKLLVSLNVRELKNGFDLTESICDQILPRDTKVNRNSLREYLTSHANEVLIVLDGADEFERGDSETPCQGEIIDVISNKMMRGCTLVVTTRPHMVDKLCSLNPLFSRIETKGFSDARAKEYIQRFFGENASEAAPDLYLFLITSESLRDLAKIPLMLLLMCLVWSESRRLPETLTDLFNTSLFFIMKRQLNKLGPSNIDDEYVFKTPLSELVKALGKVALDGLMLPGQRLLFPASVFGDSKFVQEACAIGILTRERTRSKIQSVQTVTFLHKTFQEVIAGFYWASLFNSDHESFDYYRKKVTEENAFGLEYVLRFCCGANVQAAGSLLKHVASAFIWEKPKAKMLKDHNNLAESVVVQIVALETHFNRLKKRLWLMMYLEAQDEGLQSVALSLYKQGLVFDFNCTADEWIAFKFLIKCASKSCGHESFLAEVQQVALSTVNLDNAPVVVDILRYGVNVTDVGLVLEECNSFEWQMQLGEALAQMPCLNKLSLSGRHVNESQDLSTIFEHFAKSDRARFLQYVEVALVPCGLDDLNLVKFFQEPDLDLRWLRLVDNNLSEKVVKEVGVILGKSLDLEVLDLSGNNISSGFSDLVKQLPKLERLQVLRLKGTSLLADQMIYLVREVIPNMANPQILTLSRYAHTQAAVSPEALASVIEGSCGSSLKELEIKQCTDPVPRGVATGEFTAKKVTTHSLIESLDISNNHFGKLTPRVIRLLTRMPFLKYLDMSGMGLVLSDALELAKAIPSCQQLKKVHMGGNNGIGSDGIEALLRALPNLPNLIHISLPDKDDRPSQFVQECLACGKGYSTLLFFYEFNKSQIQAVVDIVKIS